RRSSGLPVLAQAELAREHGVSRARAMAGSIGAMVVGVMMAGTVGAVGLVIAAPGSIRQHMWALIVVVMLLRLLYPAALTSVITLVTRLLRRPVEHIERSEEHTSELQSRENLVCRLLLEKKKKKT